MTGWVPPAPRRPGTLLAAGVIGCVLAGLSVPGAALTYWTAGFSSLYAAEDWFAEGAVLAVAELLLAVPLLVGGILAITGSDRWTLLLSAALVVLLAGYWLVRTVAAFHDTSVAVAAVVFAALGVAALVLCCSRSAAAWSARRRSVSAMSWGAVR